WGRRGRRRGGGRRARRRRLARGSFGFSLGAAEDLAQERRASREYGAALGDGVQQAEALRVDEGHTREIQEQGMSRREIGLTRGRQLRDLDLCEAAFDGEARHPV